MQGIKDAQKLSEASNSNKYLNLVELGKKQPHSLLSDGEVPTNLALKALHDLYEPYIEYLAQYASSIKDDVVERDNGINVLEVLKGVVSPASESVVGSAGSVAPSVSPSPPSQSSDQKNTFN